MSYIIPYNTILPEFCAQRCSAPSIFGNGGPITVNPRIIFLRKLLYELDLDYEMDMWTLPLESGKQVYLYNFYLRGSSNKILMAHHDIANPNVDNCNDNTASVINAIAAKIHNPDLNIAITDCEEFGGKGAQRLSEKINDGYFGKIEFVLNLELSAAGGMSFFTEDIWESKLARKIQDLFEDTPTVQVPFHDGVILRKNKIDCVVINPLPLDMNGNMKFHYLNYCHSEMDTIALANYDDMGAFVRYVITPIIIII